MSQERSDFLNLKPEQLSKALTALLVETDPNLTEIQILQAKAVFFIAAGKGINIAEQKARIQGDMLPARKMSPLSSASRVGAWEQELYDLLFAGDEASIKSVISGQEYTTTAHPSFSRTRELKQPSNNLVEKIADFPLAALKDIAETGQFSEENRADIQPIIEDIALNLKVRTKKRDRADELQETVLDTIPTIVEADREQLHILEKRSGRKFESTKALRAASALLPEHNSWFLDGDGKRTVHVFDAEFGIPAVKQYTLEQYRDVFNEIAKRTKDKDLEKLVQQLDKKITLYEEVAELAKNRMDALNVMDAAYTAKDSANVDTILAYEKALEAAKDASQEYRNKLHSNFGGIEVKDVLVGNDAESCEKQLESLLDKHFDKDNTYKLDADLAKTAAGMYATAYRRGNYMVKFQRRENAGVYREVLRYLAQNEPEYKKALSERLDVSPRKLLQALEDPDIYLQAVEMTAASAMDPNDPLRVRESFLEAYRASAQKLGSYDEKSKKYTMIPLQERELETLDALGHFRMAHLYSEAFKAGFITAEYAQPNMLTLTMGTEEEIKEEVIRTAKADMLLQVAFAHAMGAGKLELIPLHEDPVTMKYAAEANEALLKHEVYQAYIRKFIGVETREDALKKAVRKLDDNRNPVPLTSYEFMREQGVDDEEMIRRGMDPEEHKQIYVLEGPDFMDACSDNTKRMGSIGLEMAEMSVRERALVSCKNAIEIAGQRFVIINPKYYGQGGSYMRATGVPMDVRQQTNQGEHQMWQTAESLAFETVNRTLSRFAIRQGVVAGEELQNMAAAAPGHVSNTLGVPVHELRNNQRELLFASMDQYIAHTRDDKRCDMYLKKYGIKVPNWSARADNKTESSSIFIPSRAIGAAGQMMRKMNNIISTGNVFDTGSKGLGAGEITDASAKEIRDWLKEDAALQQVMTSGATMACIVDPVKTWAVANIVFDKEAGTLTTKDGKTATLDALMDAFKKGANEYTDPKTGAAFDAADLYLADLTRQQITLEKGLLKIYGKEGKDLIEIFEPEHQGTIKYYKELYDEMIALIDKNKDKKGSDLDHVKGIYYILFESGPETYPRLSLPEERRYGKGSGVSAPTESLAETSRRSLVHRAGANEL